MKRPRLPYRQQQEDDTDIPAPALVTISAEIAKIRKGLKREKDDSSVTYLNTGFPYLNAVIGDPVHGIPFGRIIEISGEESHGKTALALELAGMAQRNNGAAAIMYDAEGSFDATWAEARGLCTTDRFHLVQTYMVKEKDGTRHELDSAEIFTELRMLVELLHNKAPDRPIVLIVDSIASLVTPRESSKDIEDFSMRETADLAMFMSQLMRKWAPKCRNNNVLMICINQLRTKPGMSFGDPRYTPGGKALSFYASVRCRMARVKGGTVLQGGQPIGAKGIITNMKNKTAKEKAKCGFKIYFDLDGSRPSQYLDEKEIKRDA